MRHLRSLAAVVVVLTAASTAQAGEPAAPRSRLGLAFGVAAPTGLAGVESARIVHPHLEVSAGLGFDRDGARGGRIHGALMPRLRATAAPLTLTAGVGVSGSAVAQWTDVEVGLEVSNDHLFARVSVGEGFVLARTAEGQGDGASHLDYAALTFGVVF